MKLLNDILHATLTGCMWFMSHLSELTAVVAFIVLCLQGVLFIMRIKRACGGTDGKEGGE